MTVTHMEPIVVRPHRWNDWRLYAAAAAVVLTIGMVIALVATTFDRNDARHQLALQTQEQRCRSAAASVVNQAAADVQSSIANAIVALGRTDRKVEFPAAVEIIAMSRANLQKALNGQKSALAACQPKT